jgi:hypothetical protein
MGLPKESLSFSSYKRLSCVINIVTYFLFFSENSSKAIYV